MKSIKTITLILFLSLCVMNAQQKNTITVFGETIKKNKIKDYIVNIEFREIYPDNYRNVDGKTIDQVKKEYASALSKVNIDFSQFEEDVLYRLSSYAYNTSEFYIYHTNSMDEVKRILSQKVEGVINTRVDVYAEELSDKEIGELCKKATEDAKSQAMIIASNIGRKIGKVVAIENSNHRNQGFYIGSMKQPTKYHIKVTFLLED
ncbi:SIMPL domain-containing protein [Aquimarina brevivitae]|uniref:Uncharacterized protein DUF541 n=1 Tax=Aquimarina brevivitae TaxID=323412 RepID=A0A4Q7PHW7_9FLAO|nr:SIMPL domain-containing protein [Aquimarina brevivitae]RZS99548.1 uncharacterized protein DUF541 [Aquimarina brevivitae]